MAAVEITQPYKRTNCPDMTITNLSSRYIGTTHVGSEIEKKLELKTTPSKRAMEDTMFVALGRDAKESESVLMWALHNFSGMGICVLHVHQPAQKIATNHIEWIFVSLEKEGAERTSYSQVYLLYYIILHFTVGGEVLISPNEERIAKARHEIEKQDIQKTLDKYIRICEQAGVQADKICVEMDSIGKGIVHLVAKHGIKWLVMGAATNENYSRKMKEPMSNKAIHVLKEAPDFCKIWFICKGNLIHTRECKSETESQSFLANPTTEAVESLRSLSVGDGVRGSRKLQNLAINYHGAKSDIHGMQPLTPNSEWSSDCETLSRRSPSVGSRISTCSSSEIEEVTSTSPPIFKANELVSGLPIEQNVNELYGRLELFLAEAESSPKEAYDGSIKHKKAEKDVIDAFRKAKASETMYAEELKCRNQLEEALDRGKKEVKKMKMQLGEVMEELRIAQEHQSSLESQIANSDKSVEDLKQKMFSAVELLQKYKMERDELQVLRDNALRVVEELRDKQAEEASSSSISQFFSVFSFSEIEEATGSFSEGLKIGEGGYGSIYRGNVRCTQVAVKVLHANSSKGPLEFQQEVNILSKLRHPNIITLIGACPEAWALVYEYLPNGSLEDRLNCKNNTSPLPWKSRLRIASDLCSALVFLHSRRPQPIVHGDLKPSNILLDSNFVAKLSNFGICRELQENELLANNTKGTLVYMDPEFLASGELSVKSDVYSFGIVLLRLLTGRPASEIAREVQCSLDKGSMKFLLDPTAGDWPFVQAEQLAHLGVSCTDVDPRRRPDLVSEVWRVLENMKASCSGFCYGEKGQVPAYFVCPIFQEIMQDPVAAADGFTYESEALKGWLESHDTSPMTNDKLANHDFLPNHALRSAIQEWLAKS
ncbi:U-box domain-containing protein kinase family protein [Striga asiatica]|uniref:RING-type E3 ubiquitin transferase n=1 Tax=Striga asiatica TaxID=4170 RepID=A0A5A7QLA2_STRAF|nr:U-box domain-containing protein kinase family protein [Striga asiatica]